MRDTIRAEVLLSLFTTPEHAEAIAGDLTEERAVHGRTAFWIDVARVLAALWRRSVVDAPLTVLMLALLACVLFVGPAVVGVAAVGLFPTLIHSPVPWIGLSLIWCAGALGTGASVVGISYKRGMVACTTLAVVVESMLITVLTTSPRPDRGALQVALSYTAVLLVPPLLVFGAAFARRRAVTDDVATIEEAR